MREKVKALIELSTDEKEVDRIINEYYGFKTIKEKIAFLKGMFDVSVVAHDHDEIDANVYAMIIRAIIDKKWN